MQKRFGFWILACFLAALAACHRAPDEVRVREAIASAQRAAGGADASGVVEPLGEDFEGNQGSLGRNDIANLVRLAHLRGERIGVTLGPISVERRGERLVADFTVTLTQGSRLLPDAAGIYQVTSAWRREGSEWRCYSATWKRQL
jgi:hypothetical protein